MKLIEEYVRQQSWREWDKYIKKIPLSKNQKVIDLGCSVGAVSRLLSHEVKSVSGFDLNNDFIKYAKENSYYNIEFYNENILDIDFKRIKPLNGVWSSFTLSYLSEPINYIKRIYKYLSQNGWIALLDISDFISGNMYKKSRYYKIIKEFEEKSYENNIYDFNFGAKISKYLRIAGFKIFYEDNDVEDIELNFDGPASEEIRINWEARLNRIQNLKKLLKDDYQKFYEEFIEYLISEEHCRNSNLKYVIAIKKQNPNIN